jgi:hypothetical protein
MNGNKANISVVIINSLFRHDLLLSSCVNNEVAKLNRQLKKIVKLHPNLELQRKHFTKYGQHLNYSGKKLVTLELAKSIEQFLNKTKTAPNQIQWKDDNTVDLNLDIHVNPVGHCTSVDSKIKWRWQNYQ